MAVIALAGKKVFVGLEEKNLEKMRAGLPFHKLGDEIGLPFDLVIYYGKTADDLMAAFKEFMGPETVTIDHRNAKRTEGTMTREERRAKILATLRAGMKNPTGRDPATHETVKAELMQELFVLGLGELLDFAADIESIAFSQRDIVEITRNR